MTITILWIEASLNDRHHYLPLVFWVLLELKTWYMFPSETLSYISRFNLWIDKLFVKTQIPNNMLHWCQIGWQPQGLPQRLMFVQIQRIIGLLHMKLEMIIHWCQEPRCKNIFMFVLFQSRATADICGNLVIEIMYHYSDILLPDVLWNSRYRQ